MAVAISRSMTSAVDWSIAYAVTIRRLDSRFMLCLLRLDSWPNLGSMHGDLVDAMKLICALLERRPMVGFLVAHRLNLPVNKTYALLSVLQTKGHVVTVGTKLGDDRLAIKNTVSEDEDAQRARTTKNGKSNDAGAKVVAKDIGYLLNQLCRVLNTDIAWTKSANASQDPNKTSDKDVGEVLRQLWRVLNTEIGNKRQIDSNLRVARATDTMIDSNDKLSKLGRILDTEITLKKKSKTYMLSSSLSSSSKALTHDTSGKAISRLSQLWQVLNSEIVITVPPER